MEYCVSNDQMHCDQNCWWNLIAINLHIHMRHWQWLTVILPDPTLALVLLSIHLIPSVLFWVWRWLIQADSHLVALLYTSMETTFLYKWSLMHLKICSENKSSIWKKFTFINVKHRIPKYKLASRHVCLLIQQIQPKHHWWSDSHKYLNSVPLISNIVCYLLSHISQRWNLCRWFAALLFSDRELHTRCHHRKKCIFSNSNVARCALPCKFK